MSRTRSFGAERAVWRDQQHWDSLEVLASIRTLDGLRTDLLRTGGGTTRHYLPARELFLFADWRLGPDEYVALQSRVSFLASRPGEAGLVGGFERRRLRVEFASVVAGRVRALAPEAAIGDSAHAFARVYVRLLTRLRERCALGPGYLVPVGEEFVGHLGRLALHDRHVEILRAAGQPRRPIPSAMAELERFDRELEVLRHAG